MIARLTFLAIAGFWVTMNLLLWRAEFALRGAETPVPVETVWQKILTAPDASALTIFQNNKRAGFCEFSTSVGKEMAEMDEDKLPSENLVSRAGYQVHLIGSIEMQSRTNRLKFDGRIRFNSAKEWREFSLKFTIANVDTEIFSIATNQSVRMKISGENISLERTLTFAELQDPAALLRVLAADAGMPMLGELALPGTPSTSAAAQGVRWKAVRTRAKIGAETLPIYRLETAVLGQTFAMDISPIGEILQVTLPGNYVARIDQLIRHD